MRVFVFIHKVFFVVAVGSKSAVQIVEPGLHTRFRRTHLGTRFEIAGNSRFRHFFRSGRFLVGTDDFYVGDVVGVVGRSGGKTGVDIFFLSPTALSLPKRREGALLENIRVG